MKKLLKITTILLILTMVVGMAACSSFGKVQKALEDIGYAIIENKDNDLSEDAKNDESVAKVYMFNNANSLSALEIAKLTLVTVIEFNSTKELVEYYKENNTLQGIVADVEKDGTIEEVYNQLKAKGLACGNCIIAPIGLDASNVLTAIINLNK